MRQYSDRQGADRGLWDTSLSDLHKAVSLFAHGHGTVEHCPGFSTKIDIFVRKNICVPGYGNNMKFQFQGMVKRLKKLYDGLSR